MRNILFSAVVLLSTSVSFAAPFERWEEYSNPSLWNGTFEKSFTRLPLTGANADTQKLWASDYWPRRRGGINYRWNAANKIGFKLKSPTKAEAVYLSQEQISALAPSEKLDLLNGNYDYPLVKAVDYNAAPGAPLWHGICNGWAPAAVNHNEPTPKTLINPDGIPVPFGSSDIKALISYYYAFVHEVPSTRQLGTRCGLFGQGCGQDLNAGAFHIVLANRVGLEQSSFVADVEGGKQVWNHAVTEYKSTVLSSLAPARDSAKGTVKRVLINTEMTFVQEIKHNDWNPTNGTDLHVNASRKYEYTLDLDMFGNIIGGQWISKVRPDFLWGMDKATTFTGKFVRMSELLND